MGHPSLINVDFLGEQLRHLSEPPENDEVGCRVGVLLVRPFTELDVRVLQFQMASEFILVSTLLDPPIIINSL